MVSLMSLWLPILLSAVAVFLISSVIHTVLKYHAGDFRKLSNEDEVLESLRRLNIPPGDYMIPCASSMEAKKSPDFAEKIKAGPVAVMTFMDPRTLSMGPQLVLWFLFSILVSVIAAYVAGSALPRGASYLSVFRFAGAVSFTGYAIGLIHDSIWYKRNWGTTLKFLFDGLVYGLVTAGVFGWLWPR
jgi:hypothetical protein